jgi:tRNA-specific 2-thiouridylase
MSERVIVGMSGGVDSSVAAHLLIEQGYAVEGLFMNNWDDDDSYCTAAQDYQDARQVAADLGIPLHKANFAAEYKDRVFSYFLEEHKAGRTPNPDVLCNREIKFKAFLEYAIELGADKIATGHYARVTQQDGQFHMFKGVDNNKDQTYFLQAIGQYELSKTLFPVGELPKPEVRAIAEEMGLHTFDKKDSTGICFIGERDFVEFLQKYLPAQPGEIQTPDGDVIGKHNGLMYHTLGQRKGLGIGGLKNYNADEPWFVSGKDLERNVLIAVQGHDNPLLFKSTLNAIDLHWVAGNPPTRSFSCTAKTRYRQADQQCVVNITDNGAYVEFENPQRAVTPGQWIVLYQGEDCLGGGIIDY